MLDCCTIFLFSLLGSLCCFCGCICTKNKIYNDLCPFESCCNCPPSSVSNMPTALINQQPGLNNLDGLNNLYGLDNLEDLDGLNNLPKYDEIDEINDDIIINEVIFIDILPPPEYIP